MQGSEVHHGGGIGFKSWQRSPVTATGWWRIAVEQVETKRIGQGRFIGRVAGQGLGGDPRRRHPVAAWEVVRGIRAAAW